MAEYLNQSQATSTNLVRVSPSQVYLGVDTAHVYPTNGPGRPSVRLESKQSYTHGLYVLNVSHMPQGCGTWPAFWSLGPDWPNNGEIDIVENVNRGTQNLMSMHTSAGCTIAGADQTGTLLTDNCDVANSTTGCGVQSRSQSSAGTGLNRLGGGVYAMEWTSQAIRVWNFPQSSVPSSIRSGAPDPGQFGEPVANFQGSCNIDRHFAGHRIVIDTTFCGDYAGNVYASSGCPLTSGQSGMQSCVDFVARNPSQFMQVYWSVDSLRVYHLSGSASSSAARASSTSLSSVKPVASTKSMSTPSLAMGTTSAKQLSMTTTTRPAASAAQVGVGGLHPIVPMLHPLPVVASRVEGAQASNSSGPMPACTASDGQVQVPRQGDCAVPPEHQGEVAHSTRANDGVTTVTTWVKVTVQDCPTPATS